MIMYRKMIDEILMARVALKRGALCWKYRVKARWQNSDNEACDDEDPYYWEHISYFFESGTLLEVDAFWTRVGLVDWRNAETLTIGQEARPQTLHTRARGAKISQTPPPLPLELKALIAEQVPPATLVNLCAAARDEYMYMTPILYRSIVQDVRTPGTEELLRLAQLLSTLSTRYPRNLGPYPATLVRELRLRCTVQIPSWLEGMLQEALRCTVDHAPELKSKLRTFHLNINEITILPLLSERPAFENLAELSVVRSGSNTSQFEFLQIPGLKSLAYKNQTLFNREEPTMNGFCRSLELLPTISPDLTVLKMDISWNDFHIPLLEKIVNSLRLPRLEVASIQVFVNEWEGIPNPDFNPFLEAHPTLYDVSVVLGSQPLRDDALPLLRTFTGRAGDFLKVCDGARPIRDLAVTLFLCNSKEEQTSERGRAVVAALAKIPNLRRLAIVNGYDAVYDSWESADNGIYMHGLDHSMISTIGKTCSRITHLELHLKSAKKADVEALANLHELQWLRAHFWITIPNGGGPASNMYDDDFLDTDDSEDEDYHRN
ncbi:hypothetical protein B0H16DRAFT_1892117 [Mycena metata]|uniref:Uncharacterized protein n=1 Tax=Mycena metata TaxID=1033252 RepID=A0AAD7MWF3_9AGAR|nr:hypothetical protein B0H16DRAFT_1892117 [Mycena metata]